MSNNEKLCIFIENYTAGGSDIIAGMLARTLNNYDIYILENLKNDDVNLLNELKNSNIVILKYKLYTVVDFASKFYKNLDKKNRYIYYFIKSFFILFRYPYLIFCIFYFYIYFKKMNFKVIITNNGGYPGGDMCRVAAIAGRMCGARSIMIVHSMPEKPPHILVPIEFLIDKIISSTVRIVVVSRKIGEEILKLRFISNKIFVISNIIKRNNIFERFDYKGVNKIIVVGSLTKIKDQIKAVKIFYSLLDRLNDEPNLTSELPKLYFYGKIVDIEYYNQLIHEVRSRVEYIELVKFNGFCAIDDVLRENGLLLLISSNDEGMPLVLIEAMAYGVPCVSTDVGGVTEVVQNARTGYTCSVDDIQALSDEIFHIVKNPSHYRELSQNCIYDYSSFPTVADWSKAYMRVILNDEADLVLL